MRITRVTAELRQSPFRDGGTSGNVHLRDMATLLVRIDTYSGPTGWSEAFGFS